MHGLQSTTGCHEPLASKISPFAQPSAQYGYLLESFGQKDVKRHKGHETYITVM
jgi:hypothetical protein